MLNSWDHWIIGLSVFLGAFLFALPIVLTAVVRIGIREYFRQKSAHIRAYLKSDDSDSN